jgi:hypothetical protein
MKRKEDPIDELFSKHQFQWDIENLDANHEVRFKEKLNQKKFNWRFIVSIGIAASLAIFLFTTMGDPTYKKPSELQYASKETIQTDSIFTVLIERELEKINEKKSPENKKIIVDALSQMKILDADYDKIIQELEANGESKQIIYAMISNLQTRISFLQKVLEHLEINEQKKVLPDEKTM